MSNILIYVASGALVYSLLLGIHYTFTAGLKFKLYAVAYFLVAAFLLLLMLFGIA